MKKHTLTQTVGSVVFSLVKKEVSAAMLAKVTWLLSKSTWVELTREFLGLHSTTCPNTRGNDETTTGVLSENMDQNQSKNFFVLFQMFLSHFKTWR